MICLQKRNWWFHIRQDKANTADKNQVQGNGDTQLNPLDKVEHSRAIFIKQKGSKSILYRLPYEPYLRQKCQRTICPRFLTSEPQSIKLHHKCLICFPPPPHDDRSCLHLLPLFIMVVSVGETAPYGVTHSPVCLLLVLLTWIGWPVATIQHLRTALAEIVQSLTSRMNIPCSASTNLALTAGWRSLLSRRR